MTSTQKTPDITVRGGLINIPGSAKPLPIPRHQPNTPITKKNVKPRADHQPVNPDPTPPPTQIPVEPEGDKPNVPTPPSQSD